MKFSSQTQHLDFLDGQYTVCGTKNQARNGSGILMSSSLQRFSSKKLRKPKGYIRLSQFPSLKSLALQLLLSRCLKYSGNGEEKSAKYPWILLVCLMLLFVLNAANNVAKGIQMDQTMRFTLYLVKFRGQGVP